jgi:predicted dehydrogenase
MNRRDFLQASLLAAAVPAPSAHAAAAKKVAASDRVRVAMMGVRGRGVFLAKRFSTLPDVEIPTICDVDESVVGPTAKIIEEVYGKAPKLVSDIRRVLDDPNIDAVVMATPIHWHAAGAILACQAGKDIYVEKPISHNIREGRLIVEAAHRYQRVVQHGTQSRSRPVTERFVEYVQSGKIGKLLMVTASDVQGRPSIGRKGDEPVPAGIDYETWTGPVPKMPFNRNRFHGTVNWHWHFGTGDTGNSGAHTLDVARWILKVGYPNEVSGMGRMLHFDDDQQTPDTMNITFEYDDVVITYEQRIWSPYRGQGTEEGVFVYGTDGMAQMGRWVGGHWAFRVFDNKGALVRYEQEDTPENDTHARNFIDCIRSREKPNADAETGHVSSVLCHLANIVARVNRTVRFDPKSETIIDDPEANKYVQRTYRQHWSTPQGV